MLLKMCLLAYLLCLFSLARTAPIEKIMVDMSHVYDEKTLNYPMWKKFDMTVIVNGSVEGIDWLQGEEMTTATHMGTHMDAPSHFVLGGLNIDEISLSSFIAPAAVINIEAKTVEDTDALMEVEDLEYWERVTGQSLNGTIVLVNSGWGKKWHNRTAFLGTTEEDAKKLHFPGISEEAAQWLVDKRDIIGIGMDTMSFDKGNSRDFPAHKIILGKGLFGLENVANMDKIPIYGATLYVMPMKIGRASGAPTRVIATFPKIVFDMVQQEP